MKSIKEALGSVTEVDGLSNFEKAFVAAHRLNKGNTRKSTKIPYVSHLMAVSALVMENEGTEDQATAALLHDTIEDQQVSAAEISEIFGSGVADIVVSCTDAHQHPKPRWRGRKEKYLAHLRDEASDDALLVALADKLHNARAILNDKRREGDNVWKRFNAGKEEQQWYFTEIVKTMSSRSQSPMVAQLESTVREMFGT